MRRRAGVLAHPTVLPGGHGVGDLGPSSRSFLAWLSAAGFSGWQVLPLSVAGRHGCPYSSPASRLGEPLLISLEDLAEGGLLRVTDLPSSDRCTGDCVDFVAVEKLKRPLLQKAAKVLLESRSHPWTHELERFRAEEPGLRGVATFRVLKRSFGSAPWWEWPDPLKWRDEQAMAEMSNQLSAAIAVEEALGFLFDKQWSALKLRAGEEGIALVGDLPIYVAAHSADVWLAPELFDLTATGKPAQIAGVPPDQFAPLGQRWENPLYNWEVHATDGFSWWCDRVAKASREFDLIRLDHFRGFVGYYAIESSAPDARDGVWLEGPGSALFAAFRETLGSVPFIAEDLGTITDDVNRLRESLELPSMRVLQFGLDGDQDNPHAPVNIGSDSVVYTGTHDNPTSQGWWDDADDAARIRAIETTGGGEEDFVESLIGQALQSPAQWAFVPVQDLLGLGNEARMNVPGTVTGNWDWRLKGEQLDTSLAVRLRGWLEHARRLVETR